MQKVTLVYPGISSVGFNSFGDGIHDSNWINLGLAYIGAYLKEHDYSVDLIDLRTRLSWDDFEEDLKSKDPNVVGIYFNTINYHYAVECARIAKALKKIVVAGGPHVTIDANEIHQTGYVDYTIQGEGEISFFKLLEALKNGHPISKNIVGERVENLDDLPFPDRDLFQIEKVVHTPFIYPFIESGVTILSSRGCPFRCTFCQPLLKNLFGKKVRRRSVDNVIREIEFLKQRYDIRMMHFDDDTFTIHREWVEQLCHEMIARKLKVEWTMQSRVDTFDDRLARIVKKAGCVGVFLGFESGSQRILDLFKKDITPEQSIRAAKACRDNGLIIIADYIIGAPGETPEELQMTHDLMKAIRPEIHFYSYFSPIPGSELHDYCKERDLIQPDTYEDFSRNIWKPQIKGLDYSALERLQQELIVLRPKWYSRWHLLKMSLKRWYHFFNRKQYRLILDDMKANS